MNRIADYITASRAIIFAPLAGYFLANGFLWPALCAMVLGELTDAIDGIVARKMGQVSAFGKLLDPCCDSIFRMTIWIAMLFIGWVPLWAVILFFTRDSVVSMIRQVVAKDGTAFAARKSGKIKAALQALAQFTLVASHTFLVSRVTPGAQTAAICVAAAATVWSVVDYSYGAYRGMHARGTRDERRPSYEA